MLWNVGNTIWVPLLVEKTPIPCNIISNTRYTVISWANGETYKLYRAMALTSNWLCYTLGHKIDILDELCNIITNITGWFNETIVIKFRNMMSYMIRKGCDTRCIYSFSSIPGGHLGFNSGMWCRKMLCYVIQTFEWSTLCYWCHYTSRISWHAADLLVRELEHFEYWFYFKFTYAIYWVGINFEQFHILLLHFSCQIVSLKNRYANLIKKNVIDKVGSRQSYILSLGWKYQYIN